MSNYTALKEKFVTTRKVHSCEWCGEPIDMKCRALYRSGVFQDIFMDGWLHPECFNFGLSEWNTDDPDEGFYPGTFKRGSTEQR